MSIHATSFKVFNRMCSRILGLAGIAAVYTGMSLAQAGMGPGSQSAPPSQQSPNAEPNNGMSSMDKNMSNMNNAGDQTMTDKMFVHKALEGGMAEVELGQLALTKTSDPDIKNFAQKMVDDHTKLGDDMKGVAQQVGVKVPTKLSKKDEAIKAKLSALDGTAFDQAYIKDMVKDHEQDEKEFKDESQMAAIPAVKQAATKGEHVIHEHLEMITQIAESKGVKGE